MSATSLTSDAPALAAPIPGGERIAALDVIRGFALCGILLMNVEFYSRPLQEIGTGLPPGLTGIDWLAGFLVYILVQGKFWTMFSLLFGMGFAVMLTRAERAGRNFLRPYLRRIAALAVFGALHYILVWGGDILFSYSVAALGLLIVLYGRAAPILVSAVVIAVLGGLGAAGILPGGGALMPVLFGLLLMGLAAMYLRSDATITLRGRQWPAMSVILLSLGVLVGIAAAATWILEMPVEVRWPATIFTIVLILLGWPVDRGRDDDQRRMLRLGVGMYLLPFVVMLLFGLGQLLMGPQPAPPGGEAALAQLRAQAAQATSVNALPPPVEPRATVDAKPAAQTPESRAQAWAQARLDSERQRSEFQAEITEEARVESAGSYPQAVAYRAKAFVKHVPDEAGFAVMLVGMFLVGTWFVRSGVMDDTRGQRPLFRKLAWIGIPVGLGLGLVGASISTAATPGLERDPYFLAMALMMIGNLPACLGYVGLVVLMLHSSGPASRIAWLAPLGRMALTNYITHSLVGTWLFYGHGLGLWGMGRAAQVGLVFALLAVQLLFCHWWLARFRYGPLEWLWRAITYWQVPPMRRDANDGLQARAAA